MPTVQEEAVSANAAAGASRQAEDAVLRLARAVHRCRAYPAGSPLALEGLRAARQALATIPSDALVLRVAHRRLLVDDTPLPALPAIAELADRLHQSAIASVSVSRDVSDRELTAFCRELAVRDAGNSIDRPPVPDVLRDLGVERVVVTAFEPPAVLDAGRAMPSTVERVLRRASAPDLRVVGGCLFPPGKGWVRVDPYGAPGGRVTLTGLAELVENPFALAEMLVALSDDPVVTDPGEALARRFDDLVTVFRTAEPPLAERLLATLARAVLALDTERRTHLLRSSILPGLLEGRHDGSVLRHLPDLELADALSLLLELQLAAPDLLVLALDRMDLPDERRRRLEPLLQERLAASEQQMEVKPGAIDGLTDDTIRVDLSREKEFRDFVSFDLSVGADTARRLADLRDAIARTDGIAERARCLLNLIRIEANPDVSARLLDALRGPLQELRQAGSWDRVADTVRTLRQLREALAPERVEVVELIDVALQSLVDADWLGEACRRLEHDPNDRGASALIEAAGPWIVTPLVQALQDGAPRARSAALVKAMSAHAGALATALSAHLTHPSAAVVRDIVAIIGHAAPGAERLLEPVLQHADEAVARETYRALVRFNTPSAMALVSTQLRSNGPRATLAEDALWRFPPDTVCREVCALLTDATFAVERPQTARRLLARADRQRMAGLADAARHLAALRWRFWRPSTTALGWSALAIARRKQ